MFLYIIGCSRVFLTVFEARNQEEEGRLLLSKSFGKTTNLDIFYVESVVSVEIRPCEREQ